jgi:hypothetical protein
MATVVKDFKIKSGLIVEGTTAKVNNSDILTKKQDDQDFIIGLIGGETLVKSVSNEFDVSEAGELSIDRTTVDAYYDAAGSADTAEDNAIAHTDAREIAITTAYEAYADTAEADAVTTANAYTDGRETAITTAYESYADQAEVDAKAYTDTRETAITTAYQSYADQAEVDAKAYTDQEVAALVGGAPELLDTLNELAAAIGDDENFAANLATSVGERVAKAGDTMTGLLVLSADPEANLGAATKQYVDTAEADAIATAEAYTDGEITTALTTAQGYADTAESNAIAHADALDTDDIEEGTNNLYHTDVRAKTSAANLLTGATLTNITITGDETGLVITAENGVDESTTDDLDEGDDNLYFTDERAVDALQGTDSMFSTVSIDEVALQVAASLSAETAGVQTAYAWAKADYRSAEFLVKVAYGDHTEISKVLLTLDVNDNIAITEYGIVGTNGSASTISATISGTDVQLLATTTNNNSTVTVVGTLLA